MIVRAPPKRFWRIRADRRDACIQYWVGTLGHLGYRGVLQEEYAAHLRANPRPGTLKVSLDGVTLRALKTRARETNDTVPDLLARLAQDYVRALAPRYRER